MSMPMSEAQREIMWNIARNADGKLGGGIQPVIMYILFFIMLAVFGYGLWLRIQSWRKGKPANERLGDWGMRLVLLVKEILFQRKVLSEKFPGIFHSFIFYSFIVLTITTAVVAMDYDLGTSFFKGWIYLTLSLGADLGGAFVLIGILIALYRRYIIKPSFVPQVLGDTWALILIAIIIITGFMAEGLRIAVKGDEWYWISPVGWIFSMFFAGIGSEGGVVAHRIIWWVHTLFAFFWMATLPYTKFFHILALPTNIFFSKLEARGHLKRDDLEAMMEDPNFDEDNFNVGIGKTSDLSWKQRLDNDACIKCGRCEQNCPAVMSKTSLNPRLLIAKIKELLESDEAKIKAAGLDKAKSAGAEAAVEYSAIIENAFDPEFVQHCRTCMACVEACPAMIHHVDTIMALRQNEVVIQGRLNNEGARALKSMESLGNPFGPPDDRVAFVEELGAKVVAAGEEVDVLYWIGCLSTYDPTKHKIIKDICWLLDKAGINWGVLGEEEVCCGDPARVMGQEYTFQTGAKMQIEALNARKFKTLLVSCPHCFNTLAHEYPQFGGKYNVMHHSVFLRGLLHEGKLSPKKNVKGKFVYHDPCYLGRYQGVFDEPRDLLKSVPGINLAEMASHRNKSLCCGGGGGHFWIDIKAEERINNIRVRQAQDGGADFILTACPFCTQMIDDSLKILNLDENMKVMDIASVLAESMKD